MFSCVGFAAEDPSKPLLPYTFDRRDPGPDDVAIEILYCGVCHSDLHTVRNEWAGTHLPVRSRPRDRRPGDARRRRGDKFKVGDLAGVGCMVDSCRTCPSCCAGLEQYLRPGAIGTYNAPDKALGGHTYGGYSSSIVVDESFVLRVPDNLDLAAAAPLLCAGITTYSPLRHWKVGPGKKVGVVGLGGLGHMGVKLAHAMGAHVTLFTTSPGKIADGQRLGADAGRAVSTDADADEGAAGELRPDPRHRLRRRTTSTRYLGLLKLDGTLVHGRRAADSRSPVSVFSLIMGRRNLAGSLIGGIAETQEMLDFCGEHGITADIELIPIQQINEAYERMLKSDVKYRFVIDMASLKARQAA